MKITIGKQEIEDLNFIFNQFILLHDKEKDIYKDEFKIARRIIKLLEKEIKKI